MGIDFTPLVRGGFVRRARRTDSWAYDTETLQKEVLRSLLHRARHTEYGRRYGFDILSGNRDFAEAYMRDVPLVEYEDIKGACYAHDKGEKDVMWRGCCHDFAQSSGTSGGRSKFIPVTKDSLKGNHYAGGADVVAHYLRMVPESRIFPEKVLFLEVHLQIRSGLTMRE